MRLEIVMGSPGVIRGCLYPYPCQPVPYSNGFFAGGLYGSGVSCTETRAGLAQMHKHAHILDTTIDTTI